MSRDYLVPPGYLPMGDALRRARLKFVTDWQPKLVGLLRSGKLSGWCSDPNGQLKPIEPVFWTSFHAKRALEQEEINVEFKFGSSWSKGRPVFLEADLDEQFPTFNQRKLARQAAEQLQFAAIKNLATQQPVVPHKNKGGRPRNSDADDFFIEAARLAVLGEQGAHGQTQVQFFDAMEAWATVHMDTPYSRDTIEQKIKLLWRACWPNSRG